MVGDIESWPGQELEGVLAVAGREPVRIDEEPPVVDRHDRRLADDAAWQSETRDKGRKGDPVEEALVVEGDDRPPAVPHVGYGVVGALIARHGEFASSTCSDPITSHVRCSPCPASYI